MTKMKKNLRNCMTVSNYYFCRILASNQLDVMMKSWKAPIWRVSFIGRIVRHWYLGTLVLRRLKLVRVPDFDEGIDRIDQ